MRVRLWPIVVLSAITGAARGDFVYVSQTRYIYADTAQNYHDPIQQARIDAPDFGPFNESLHLEQRFPPQIVDVSQSSTLTTEGITFSWVTFPQGSPPSNGGGTPRAIAVLDVTFDVTSSQPYHLSGRVDLAYGPRASLILTGPGTEVGADPISLGGGPIGTYTLDHSGLLEPGRYRLLARADATVIIGYPWASRAAANGSLQFPAPGSLIPLAAAAPLTLLRCRRINAVYLGAERTAGICAAARVFASQRMPGIPSSARPADTVELPREEHRCASNRGSC